MIDIFTINKWIDHTNNIVDNCLFFFIKPKTISYDIIDSRIKYIIDKLPKDKEFCLCPVGIKNQNYPSNIKVLDGIDEDEYINLVYKKYNEKPKKIIGITGSSGKTSTVNYVHQLYNNNDKATAYISSNAVNISLDNYIEDFPISFLCFQEFFHKSASLYELAIIECTSYCIQQKRLGSVELDGCIFTSFNKDHIDLHHNFLDYFLTKVSLINHLKPNSFIIIPEEIKYFHSLIPLIIEYEVYYISKNEINIYPFQENFHPINYKINNENIIINNEWTITLLTINDIFQSNNIMMANIIYWILEKNIPRNGEYYPINGRFHRISHKELEIFIDYAHSLEKVQYFTEKLLHYINIFQPQRKFVVVIGIASKEITTRFERILYLLGKANFMILTLDNIYGEFDLDYYVNIVKLYPNVTYIPNRQEAIEYTIKHYGNKDYIVAILGFGFENTITYKNIKTPHSDIKIIENIISQL